MKIEREHAVAVAIDYQEKLVPAMDKKERLLENSEILLAGLREMNVPILLTQQYTKGLGQTVKEIKAASGCEDYLDKITFSAFDLIEESIHAKKYVIICGIESHICVLQTVIDLAVAGYVPVLVTDCITSRKPQDVAIAIKRAEREGAILTTYEALLLELLGRAGTEEAKKILRLIK